MLVLGIETSCDETGVALLDYQESGVSRIIQESLASQIEMHALYGGVVPELASREHMKALPVLVDTLCKDSGIGLKDLDALAVTVGPGLKGCLLIGATFTQGCSTALGKKLIPVNHIEAHLLAAELANPELKPPYLSLIVSGGHTELQLVQAGGKYLCLGRTRDDAAGEAFDKSAALLGLPYPGGPTLARLADTTKQSRYTLPVVARDMSDFSFSGLKTAVLLEIKKHRQELEESSEAKAEMAYAIQEAITESLLLKVKRALKEHSVETLSVVGGVAANMNLRAKLKDLLGDRVIFPPMKWCVDNGAMIAYAGARRILAPPSFEIRSRWGIELL